MKPIVGVDLDQVLADFDKEFDRLSRKLLKKAFPHVSYDYEKCGWTKNEVDYLWFKIKHSRNFWMTLDRLPKTSELMKRASELNLVFVTGRIAVDGMSIVEQSQEWLYNQYALRDPLVIVAQQKGPVCKELGIEYFIDDYPKNCKEIKDECGEACRVSVLDTSYNQDFVDLGRGERRIERVSSVNEWLKGIGASGRRSDDSIGSPPRKAKGAKK